MGDIESRVEELLGQKLEVKANKNSVANALHRKANKVDVIAFQKQNAKNL